MAAFAALAFVVFAVPSVAQVAPTPEPASSITAAMRKEDPRLDARVTLKMPDAHLAEVLAALSARTGVVLSTDERTPLSGTRLCVICKDAPLARVLNGLWSHGSLRSAQLFWDRTGAARRWRYRLTAPPAARGPAALLRGMVQARLERQADMLIEAARLTPEERTTRPGASAEDRVMLTSDRTMERVAAFVEAVPPGVQRRVMRGEAEIQVPLSH